ncbi:MAG: MBL fold metallo-hydrolase [Actinobacteria bacterium]|nr:MBL fold metallo-hydrolase [Actinomycetota bacterium]
MDTLTLEVLRAEHGDCLLLHHGQEIVVIDGGPSGVYDAALKPRLRELMDERGQPLFIRMVVVSHIDNDHIVGLGDMFAEARERMEEQRGPAEWQAHELWLNAFGALTRADLSAGTAGVRGAALEAMVAGAPGAESKAVAAGVKSGIALHDDAIALGIAHNSSVGGDLVLRGDGRANTVDVAPGLTFTVLAPGAAQLTKLRTAWESWERDHPAPEVEAAANLDRAVFNLSSIVVLARSSDQTLLLTGDARSRDVVSGLRAAGLLDDDEPPLTVDVLKLPHHGSIRNVDKVFFERVRARNYVISANGRDGNPEDETLALLCDARCDDDEPWTLWLTYGGEPGDGKRGFHERLGDFLNARKAAGQEVDARFAKPGQRHTIALP